MVSLAGASAAYPGYQQARLADQKIDSNEFDLQAQRDAQDGQKYLVNTIKAFQQQQVPGAMPMMAQSPPGAAPTPPMPGQSSQPTQRPAQGPRPQMLGAPPPPNDPTWNVGAGQTAPQNAAGMPPGGAQGQPRPQVGQQYDWRQMAQMVMQANPNAKPGGVIAALNIAMPKMTAQSQAEWQSIQKQLAVQSAGLAREKFEFDKTQKIDKYPDAEGEAVQRYLKENPHATAADLQKFKNGFSTSSASKNPNLIALQKFIEDETARTGAEPDANVQADFLRRTRAGLGTVTKIAGQEETKTNVLEQLDSAIKQLEGQKKGGPSVTGIGGFVRRQGGEFVGNTLGISKDAPASDFETKISLIKNELPRMIAGTSRISKDERDNLNKIVRGLDPRTSPEQAIQSLKYVQQVLRGSVAAEEPQRSGLHGTPLSESVRASAMDAMKRRGWSREQVRKQLQDYGYDISKF